jgi:hypothetical protein
MQFMENGKQNIPFEMAKLMIGFFHHTLTLREKDKLDKWLEDSEENIEMFEDCTEMAFRPVQSDEDFDMEEEERELRYIIELIIKHVQQTITKKERKTLDERASAVPANKKLLEELPQTHDPEQVYHWLVERFNREQKTVRLN